MPGHGRLSDEADVVEFRDMIVIVRDRVQDMIKKGMTLDQIKAARPTRDYDPQYITPHELREGRSVRRGDLQRPGGTMTTRRLDRAGRRRGRSCSIDAGSRQAGSGGAQPARSPKDAAPVDLTGYWVSLVTEDWRWRMVTPIKGDSASVPINQAAKKIMNDWDPAKDEAAGNQCKGYGAPAIMRVPGRLHITWQDDNTLKVETDAGTQTRLLRFGAQAAPANAAAELAGILGRALGHRPHARSAGNCRSASASGRAYARARSRS